MIGLFFSILLLLHTVEGKTQVGTCKRLLQGYLTGQLSSALEIEFLKQEYRRFTEVIEKSVKKLEGRVNASFRKEDEGKKRSVYTRWGKKRCPSDTELVFSGFAAGSYPSDRYMNVETICIPKDPELGINSFNTINNYGSNLYGAIYETSNSYEDHGVPCAVCLVHNRSVIKVFPARKTCYKGWRLEYQGYLMAGTSYVCVDKHADKLPSPRFPKTYNMLFYVGAVCDVLKCPPYVGGK
ncbi:uncharacterized protein LOC134278302, partial [Saccostrea cucullata]|uniref:uncharacterized protein LOC134278302 n=1 Tax=Saccostrea cuccullata TaxID=36930 RepID=UPI002ED609E2